MPAQARTAKPVIPESNSEVGFVGLAGFAGATTAATVLEADGVGAEDVTDGVGLETTGSDGPRTGAEDSTTTTCRATGLLRPWAMIDGTSAARTVEIGSGSTVSGACSGLGVKVPRTWETAGAAGAEVADAVPDEADNGALDGAGATGAKTDGAAEADLTDTVTLEAAEESEDTETLAADVDADAMTDDDVLVVAETATDAALAGAADDTTDAAEDATLGRTDDAADDATLGREDEEVLDAADEAALGRTEETLADELAGALLCRTDDALEAAES